jgi:hypothetical protein
VEEMRGSIKECLQQTANTLQKTNVQTFQASFATEAIGRHAASRHKRSALSGRPYSRGRGAGREAAQ